MVNEEGRHSNTVINDALGKYSRIDPRDRALFVRLVHGTLEYQISIDAVIDRYSRIKVSKMKPMIRNALRMGVYQILHMERIPDSAACDEAVKLVRKTALKDLGGFVNGVMRRIAGEKTGIVPAGPSEKYSVQEWMYELLKDTVGEEKTEDFLSYALKEHGTAVRETGTDNIRILENVGNLTELPGWKEGRIIVQDPSSAVPVILAGIKEGDTVIDVCAAPGGKSVQAAEKAGPGGTVWACDLTEKKTAKISENLERLHINNVRTLVQDATLYRAEFDGAADVVLADLPCSGIGTISKKPEIKNRLSLDDCRKLAEIQSQILDNVCRYVRPGGRLVFSTCTIDHYENEDNTASFACRHPDFEPECEKVLLPDDMPRDGFYVAVFRKK